MARVGFVIYAIIVVWMPVLVVWINHGPDTPFWFLAGDAYLYLGIAQASDGWGMSYDGLRATNGFHPVWQFLIRFATEILGDPRAAMWASSMGAVVLAWLGTVLLGFAIHRFTASWVLALLVAPGVYYLVIGQALSNMPVWAFFDGMEAGLALAVFGAIAWTIAAMPRDPVPFGWWVRLGSLLAMLVLTRLDEVFVAMSMGMAVFLWGGRGLSDRVIAAAALVAPTAIGVLLFALWGLATAGMLAPVSGAAKGEGALLANAWVTLATFFAPLIDLREGLTSYTAGREGLAGGAFRVVQLVVPTSFALGFLIILMRRFAQKRWAPLLAGICAGIVIKGGYSLLSVNYWHQATWYYAVAFGMMTLGTAILLRGPVARLHRPGAALVASLLVLFASLHASLWTARIMTSPLPAQVRDFWTAAPGLQAELQAREPDLRILEFGDGLLNFALDVPVRHGFVFAGDAQSLQALRQERLLRDAYEDGFSVLSSYEYLRVPEGAEGWDSAQISAFLQTSFLDERIKAELAQFDFAMLHVARPRGVPFIRLIPKPT